MNSYKIRAIRSCIAKHKGMYELVSWECVGFVQPCVRPGMPTKVQSKSTITEPQKSKTTMTTWFDPGWDTFLR